MLDYTSILQSVLTMSTLLVGHVGVPLPNVMIKLVDVEDMKYFAANNEGEVLHDPLIGLKRTHQIFKFLEFFQIFCDLEYRSPRTNT